MMTLPNRQSDLEVIETTLFAQPNRADFGGMPDRDIALSALGGVSASRADHYRSWIMVGMVLKTVEDSDSMCREWEAWSRRSDKFCEGECAEKWQGFNPNGALKLGSLIYWAKQDGWSPPRKTEPRLRNTASPLPRDLREYGIDLGDGLTADLGHNRAPGEPRDVPASQSTDPHRAAAAEALQGILSALRNGDAMGDLRDDVERLAADFAKWVTRKMTRITVGQLQELYPHLHPPVIDGLIRERETANIISVSKVGKSWLAYSLLLSVVTGRAWLERFQTTAGRCLLIDNELHKPTLASRIKTVANAMGILPDEYATQIEVWPARGEGIDIFAIGQELDQIQPETFKVVLIDAKYRALPVDTSENDNAAETMFYNEVDRIAEHLQAAVVLIHHSSKGGQSDKRLTDVGAGAGAQSRACDSHVVLREHEEDDAFVLAAAVRSFPPVQPIALRWEFPLWVPDENIDVAKLKGRGTEADQKQGEKDRAAETTVLECCATWMRRRQIQEATGMGETRVNRAVARLLAAKLLDKDEQPFRKVNYDVFRKSLRAN